MTAEEALEVLIFAICFVSVKDVASSFCVMTAVKAENWSVRPLITIATSRLPLIFSPVSQRDAAAVSARII